MLECEYARARVCVTIGRGVRRLTGAELVNVITAERLKARAREGRRQESEVKDAVLVPAER
jgi:hypothetical protein